MLDFLSQYDILELGNKGGVMRLMISMLFSILFCLTFLALAAQLSLFVVSSDVEETAKVLINN